MGSHDAFVLRQPDRPYKGTVSELVEKVTSPEELAQAIRRQHGLSSLKLGARLLELGLIAQEQLDRALEAQRDRPKRHLGEILLELGLVSAERVQELLCEQLGIPIVDLKRFPIDEAVLRLVPPELARQCRVCPICRLDGKLFVAFADPFDAAALERVRFVAETPVVAVVAAWEELEQAIHTYYGSAIAYMRANVQYSNVPQFTMQFDRDGARINPLDASVVSLVNKMLADAHAANVSGIHLDASAGSEQVAVRFRHEGQLINYLEIPRHLRRAVVARIKSMAGIDVSAHVYEGRVSRLEHEHLDLQLRVLAVPTRDGREHIAIELVRARDPLALDMLGFTESLLGTIRQLFAKPSGLLVIAGPAGCGKTTTAHAMLDLLEGAGRKIWTVENPVETVRTGASQVEVNEAIGWDYPSAMRAIVRADPDVILVGDMQDRETSALAVQAALRGARVVSVVHAHSAAEAVARLLELGVDAYSVSDALLGALSQRLVRRLCLACRVSRSLTPLEIRALVHEYCDGTELDAGEVRAQWSERFGGELLMYGAGGCEVCNGTGYRGRIGVFELVRSGPAVRPLIRQRRPASEIAAAAVRQGMRTLKQDGIEKALAGLCDLLEVRAASA